MPAARQYILTLVIVGILCGLAQIPFKETKMEAVVKLTSCLLLMITVTRPFLEARNLNLTHSFGQISTDAQEKVQAGQETAIVLLSENIKQTTEAYICDKAKSLGASINVDVKLDESALPVPKSAVIFGTISPYAKRQLSEYIDKEIGICGDDQIWNS